MSMEDYDTFLLETAKLPKSVGSYMLARIFDDKSRSEIFNDALQRVKTNTGNQTASFILIDLWK